ncbi:MAG: PilZ domain-containing protein [Colwellia sp.]
MNNKSIEQKLSEYNEFFSIEHDFSLNILPLEKYQVTSFEQFEIAIPAPFKMASDMGSINQAALRPLQALSGITGQLVEFLNHQSTKIDLLIGYILSQQDAEEHRYQGIKFGGGGLLFESKNIFEVGQLLEIKVFLPKENCAVFCYAEVIDAHYINDHFHHKIIYHFIREDDREMLVRTSLHKQSKQLQHLAQQRNKNATT